eukprot:c26329_g2_i1 orf=245-2914(-)
MPPASRLASGVVGDEAGFSFRQTTAMGEPPAAHLSGSVAAWQAIIAYDACVRLCLRAWSRGCVEAPEFLRDECSILRNSFGLQQVLLQSEDELTCKADTDETEAAAASKPKKDVGKIKVQVRKVKITLKTTSRCKIPSLGTTHAFVKISKVQSALSAGWASVKKVHVLPPQVLQYGSQHRAFCVQAGTQSIRQILALLKAGVKMLHNAAVTKASRESYSCKVKLKNAQDEEAVLMQMGSGEGHVFHPEGPTDDLMLEVQDSRGNPLGCVLVPLASLSDELNDQLQWWPIYSQKDQECIGKVKLFISYTVTAVEASSIKWGSVGETLAYDIVLDVAMRVHHFRQRNLSLEEPWRWLLSEFSICYGVPDSYTKLRYLACIMEVATPTEDCLVLIYGLLCPIIKSRDANSLSHLEKRILADVEDRVERLLALVYENYKSLDESSPSGLTDIFAQPAGKAAPALAPAVKIFTVLHDILSSEAQMTLRNYLQSAAKKRCRCHMAETDVFVSGNKEGALMDSITIPTAYSKMKSLCMNICNEVLTDIEIHNQHVFPSSIDLPNIAAGIYSTELCNRLRAFLAAYPPSGPSPSVTELLLATADFEKDLMSRGINTIKGGVDAKDLFHLYIELWIQDRHLHLLNFCKLDKVKWTSSTTQYGTSLFVEDMYGHIKDTLNEYEVIVSRWPEYTFTLETAVADVEMAIITALQKQYADILTPLKDVMIPRKFGLQYIQKLTKHSPSFYSVPNQLGVFLNTIKRLLDTLRPKIETQMKSWVACLPVEGGNACFGERLNEVTVMLRAKYKKFLHAIVEKLVENAHLQQSTKLKKILHDTREAGGLSEIRDCMQSLSTQLMDTISHLHDVFTARVFVAICRGYWDRTGLVFLWILLYYSHFQY